MATQLIEAYSHPFHLDAFKDDYEAALRELIEAKQKNAPLPLEEKKARPAKVINLMDALRQSVSKAKNPVASERRISYQGRARRKGPCLWEPVNASTGPRRPWLHENNRDKRQRANRPLARYQRMRDFSVTAEPRGDAQVAPRHTIARRCHSWCRSMRPRGCTTTSGWAGMAC